MAEKASRMVRPASAGAAPPKAIARRINQRAAARTNGPEAKSSSLAFAFLRQRTRRNRTGSKKTFSWARSPPPKKSAERASQPRFFFFKKERKPRAESAAKRKERRSVRPEIQATFSK